MLCGGGTLLVWRRAPGLIRERAKPGPGALEGTLQEQVLYVLPGALHWAIAAVDRSSVVPKKLQDLGLIGYAATNVLLIWAMAENRFFSSAIRLQQERGQYVVTSGPYAWVRHPGYVAGITLFPFSGLALDSWWSVLPGAAFSAIILRRVGLEDQFLLKELPGYAEYARRVPWRLLPGVW